MTLDSIEIYSSILLIFIFTFLIDIIDLKILTKSFSFLRSFSYYSYFIIRVVFGFVAWSILSATNLFNVNYIQSIILLPLFSVIASITTLQNFAANVGYKNIIDLSSMFDQFKKDIANEIADNDSEKNEQLSKGRATNAYNLIDTLAEKVPLETLRSECIFVLQDSYNRDLKSFDSAMTEAKKQVKDCEVASTDDPALQRKLLASKIVYINLGYGERLLKKLP